MKTKRLLYIAGFAIVTIVLLVAMFHMRSFGNPVETEMDDHFIMQGQNETGANNIVTSIVFDYRGFDTLGEASVLFAAVLGIGVLLDWSIVKRKEKRAQSKTPACQGMSRIVRTVTRIALAVSIIFGIYVIINGHLSPGGGFQGGAIIATGFALLMIGLGYAGVQRRKSGFSILESMGLLMFITLAFLGMKTVFFDNFLAQPIPFGPNPGKLVSAGVIPLMNIAVGIEVLAALTVMLILMSKAAGSQTGQPDPAVPKTNTKPRKGGKRK